MLDAIGHVVGQDLLLGTAQSRAYRRKLGDDVNAIAVVLTMRDRPRTCPSIRLRRLSTDDLACGRIRPYTPTG